MKTLYDQLLPQIVNELSICAEENIEILRTMHTGLSGAEVYEVELKEPSKHRGKFFLKIDRKDEEFRNCEVAKDFPFAVPYLEVKEIEPYYVLLIGLAGNSTIKYKSFWESPADVYNRLTKNIICDYMDKSLSRKQFVPNKTSLCHICKVMLGSKLDEDGPLAFFLSSRLADPMNSNIQFQDKVYPNPLYYARRSVDLHDCYYLPAKIHGDFHGDNIFLNQDGNGYAVIDWALARNDGILFFDNAYFELSLLLRVFEGVSLHKWVKMVEDICQSNWDGLDFEKVAVIRQLHMQENLWIKSINSTGFSHYDKMQLGQYTARVVAGLNFAGKKTVSDTKRELAFVFTCVFLKKLLEIAGNQSWTEFPCLPWNQLLASNMGDVKGAMQLAEYCAHFSEEYQYVLICGSTLPQQELVSEHLARFPWKGVISLSTQDGESLKAVIGESKFLRHLTLDQKEDERESAIQSGDVWWAFANGHTSEPTSLTDSFPEWRNRYRKYLQKLIDKIIIAAPPQELVLLIACDSLSTQDEWKKVKRILEYFDADDSKNTKAVVLDSAQQFQINEDDFANLEHVAFPVDLAALADYASAYLPAKRNIAVWLPQLNRRSGVHLDEDDERYIASFLEVVGDHRLNPSEESGSVEAFYFGEPITWNAIDRQLPVFRRQTDSLVKDIKKKIENEEWGRVELSHAPGAGASVLVKEVCWRLRKEYPTVVVKKAGDGLFESLKRIAKLTDLPVIVLLDGDYGRSDVEAIEANLGADLATKKYILIYTYRLYRTQEARDLGILDIREAETFEQKYSDIISRHEGYRANKIAERKEELQQLTRTQSLVEFRLPFFYGMYAFHEDFVSVSQFIDKIVQRMKKDQAYCTTVSYLAIVTYFTASYGLAQKIVKKLLGNSDLSLRNVRDLLNEEIPAFVYVRDAEYRICHPVIAGKILQSIYGNSDGSLSTTAFSDICKKFIRDIRKLDGGEMPSDYADRLVTSIFIRRSQADRTDDAQDTSRNTFSMIVLLLDNPNLQEEVLQCLSEQFSQNPHCFQHYGRLLSAHSPRNVNAAKEQFDRAIQLDENNPIHYHARGCMYTRYCRSLLRSMELKTPEMIYNQCKSSVECAIQDFEMAVNLGKKFPSREDGQFNLAYPYSSILDVCTMLVANIKRCYEGKYTKISFWNSDSEPGRWCRELLAIAKRYDMNAEQERSDVDLNAHYKKSRTRLKEIQFTQSELKQLIAAHPNDPHFKFIYLSNLDTHRDALSTMNLEELGVALKYCEEIIKSTGGNDGLLWRWFQIYLHMSSFSEAHALGFLESVKDLDESVTANFLLHVLYFCRFYKTRDLKDSQKSLRHQHICSSLCSGVISGERRRACPLFLADSKPLLLTDSREKGTKLTCTLVEDIVKQQSAHMTLNLDPKFKVVFVPHYNKDLKIGQGLGTVVDATIGFSYNGLYGFDLILK